MKNKRPIAFVLAATNHGSMLVNRHDYRMVGNSAYGVGWQIMQNSCFDQEEVNNALVLLKSRRDNFGDGVVAIDCGANIGVHSIEWAQLMHGWGSVIAIEAQERIFYALSGNLTINNCFNARALWAAVGSSVGEIGVPVPDYFKPSSFGSLEIKKTDKTEFIGQEIDYSEDCLSKTRMLTIDSLNLSRIDFMKIDIEGMEMDALHGAKESINSLKPQMFIERIKSNQSEIEDFLKYNGYKTFGVGLNLLAIHESDPFVSKIKIV